MWVKATVPKEEKFDHFCTEKNKSPRDVSTPLSQHMFSGIWGKTQDLGTASDLGKTQGLVQPLSIVLLKPLLDITKKGLQAFKKS